MKRLIFQLLIILITFSCVDPIELSLKSEEEKLVVEGLITNQPGPYTIKLGRSLPFDNTQVLPAYFKPEKKASLTIQDGYGNLTMLTETEPGIYETPIDFRGTIGYSYTLQIHTADEKQYQSNSEILLDVPPIDTLISEYITYQRLITNASGNQVEVTNTGFKLIAKFSDPSAKKNFYRWKSSGIFEFFSVDDNPDINRCWAPLARLENTILVTTDQYFDGNPYFQDIAIFPYDRPTYFLATVEQYSLTEESYEFWNRLKDQQLNTGSIFDSAPAPVKGNIKNINTPNETVFGYFGASGVHTKSVLINRLQSSNFVSPSPYKQPLPGNCLLQEPFATNVKPIGFP